MNDDISFLDWFKQNKKTLRKISNNEFNNGYDRMIEQADKYKAIPEFQVMIAEMNRRSSNKDFWANFIIAIVALIVSIAGIFTR